MGAGRATAEARVEPLGDALDHATFAGTVTPLEHDHQLFLAIGDPVLEPDQLGLNGEQGSKILPAWEGRRAHSVEKVAKLLCDGRLGQLQLKLLIKRIGQFSFQPVLKSGRILWLGMSCLRITQGTPGAR